MAGRREGAKPPTMAERVRVKAWELHRCPDGYDGPCWGPTDDDKQQARELIEMEESK